MLKSNILPQKNFPKYAFFVEYNGILGVLDTFGAPSQRDTQGTDRPGRPRPSRRKFSARGRARRAPPLQP